MNRPTRVLTKLPAQWKTMKPWIKVRYALNWLNGSTAAGVWLARRNNSPIHQGPGGLLIAADYPRVFPAPWAGAVTVGNVILMRKTYRDAMCRRPLMHHEAVHVTQWAIFGVVGFVPLYFAASGWSYLRCKNPALKNVFEQWAGLADGGYICVPEDSAN